MSSTIPVRLDRTRIRELAAREERRLNDRTPASAEMYARARRPLAGGVASSYQNRDPWPIYLERGEGPRMWDVDGNEMVDFHNGFGSMVQGHANPAISRAVADRAPLGTHFAAPDGGRRRRGRGARPPVRPPAGASSTRGPRRRWTPSASPAAFTGRETVVKIFGSYHGHHDAVMVSIGVPYDAIGERDNSPRCRTAAASRRPSST